MKRSKTKNSKVSRVTVPIVSAMFATSAFAANAGGVPEWSVGLGLGGGWSPEYRGADRYSAEGLPWVQAKKGRVSINPVTGVSYDLVANDRWTFAPTISYARGRENTGAIAAFDNVHGSLMAGVVANWTGNNWQVNGDIAAPVSGDVEGVRVRGYLRYRGQITQRLLFGAGPGMSWGNERWNQSLFGVSAEDSARSGLKAYTADKDYMQASMNGRLTYLITRQLSVSTVARYSRLIGNAADSPIVEDVGDANQWHGSMAINYQF
ncbi:MipA/OmpV family protein [Marinobacter salexigens]|uniref:MipA/OmpV family protein n=1 Tax=Marinobacter salexigens TaxID=1925763 RepID=UPI0019604A78|nr:MipA/OmpV family protein [Marinobacter salexigens]